MDQIELRELQRAAKKLPMSSVPPESILNKLVGLPPKQQEPKVYTSKLPTLSFAKDPNMAKDLVQSLLLPVDTLKMQEIDCASYKHGAFEPVL